MCWKLVVQGWLRGRASKGQVRGDGSQDQFGSFSTAKLGAMDFGWRVSLLRRGIEVHVIQPSSLPVDRRARRAKTDVIDVEMLLRTLMAWLRGEPRVCSMVPIPSEADEEARRAYREREDLTGSGDRSSNKIDGILATLGVKGYKALRRDRREQLTAVRQLDGDPIPSKGERASNVCSIVLISF